MVDGGMGGEAVFVGEWSVLILEVVVAYSGFEGVGVECRGRA
jgi:hypothetical protein